MANVKFLIETEVMPAIKAIEKYQASLAQTANTGKKAAEDTTSAFDRVEKVLGKMQSAVIGFIGAFVFTRVIQGINEVVQAGIVFEDTFAGIRKTVDGSASDFAKLSDQIRDMAKEIPIGVNELNKIGELAGQLGIPTQSIGKFTETIAKIGLTTNMSVEQAATDFARLANILQLPVTEIETLASTVVELGNKFPATESEIVSFSMNIAGAGRQVGLSGEQIAALSTALASTGLRAEKAGSAMSRILITMAEAADEGGKKLEAFAKISGVSAEKFKEAFEKDATVALQMFFNGLNDVDKAGGSVFKSLEDLSLQEIRVRDVTLRLKEAAGMLGDTLRVASEEAKKNGAALETEVTKRLQTARAELDKAWARIHDVAISISDKLTPAVVDGAKALASFIEFLHAWGPELTGAALGLTALAGAYAAMNLASWVVSLNAVRGAIIGLSMAFDLSVAGGAGVFATVLGTAISPLIAIPVVAAAAGAAVFRLKGELEAVTEAVKAARDAEVDHQTAVLTKVAELEKAGIPMTKYFHTIEGMSAALQPAIAAQTWWNGVLKEQADKAAAAAEAQRKLTEEMQKAHDKFRDALLPADALNKELGMLMGHMSDNDIVAVYADQILNAAAAQEKHGHAVGGAVAKLREQAEAYKEVQEILANNKPELVSMPLPEHLLRLPNDMRPDEFGARGNPLGNASLGDTADAIMGALGTNNPGPLRVDIVLDAEDLSEQIDETFTDAFDDVFKKVVSKGRVAWGDLAKIVANLFSESFQIALEPLRGILSETFNDVGDFLGKKIGSVFGDKMGKALGDMLGNALGGIAGAALGAAVGFVANQFGQGRRTADEFGKTVQNDFGEDLGKIVDATNQLAAAGKLTLQGAIEARAAVEDLWGKFKTDAAAFAAQGSTHAKVVAQAFQTLNPLMERVFADMNTHITNLGGDASMTAADLERLAQRLNKIFEISNRVIGAADGWDIMEESLIGLQAAGVPTSVILKYLGDDIDSLHESMVDLGMAIPPNIQLLHEQAEANRRLKEAGERQKEVEKELAQVRMDLAEAVNAKIDFLEGAIDNSNQSIEKWTDEIVKLDETLEESRDRLTDTKFWQDEYNKSIKDAQNTLEDVTKRRETIETQISRLETELERERLKNILETMKASENAAGTIQAELQLKNFEDRVRRAEHSAKLDELHRLQEELPKVIAQQEAAQEAFKASQEAAKDELDAKKRDLQEFIAQREAERAALQQNIAIEQEKIRTMQDDINATKILLDILGLKRQSELQQMNQSIQSLLVRGLMLEQERRDLVAITGVAAETADVFHRLGAAFDEAAQRALDAIADLGDGRRGAGSAGGGSAAAPPPPPPPPPPPNVDTNARDFWKNIDTARVIAGGLSGDEFFRRWGERVPGYAHGIEFVPRQMPAILHPGEAVLTAQENREYRKEDNGGGTTIGAVEIHLHTSGGTGGSGYTSEDLLQDLSTNKNRIRDKVSDMLNLNQRGKLIIK